MRNWQVSLPRQSGIALRRSAKSNKRKSFETENWSDSAQYGKFAQLEVLDFALDLELVLALLPDKQSHTKME